MTGPDGGAPDEAIGRRRFLGYVVAAPTLVAAAELALRRRRPPPPRRRPRPSLRS
ncbi:hypothetical protein ACFQ0B_45720 [Nonomuraea thailandensis]